MKPSRPNAIKKLSSTSLKLSNSILKTTFSTLTDLELISTITSLIRLYKTLRPALSNDLSYEESIPVGQEVTSVRELPSSIKVSTNRLLTPIEKDLNMTQIMLNF